MIASLRRGWPDHRLVRRRLHRHGWLGHCGWEAALPLHHRQFGGMSHRRRELLDHGSLQEPLNLSVARVDSLLADALGHSLHWLLGDLPASQVEQIVPARDE
jgi:hypothetical protein